MKVRTRFAPSPTGFLHVGGIRTGLFAWLVARQAGGQFILRIEDTDRERHVEAAEQHIIDCLTWLGLGWDEGPDRGGPFEPYRQSERLDIYKQWGQKLIDKGRAYADPYTKEELEAFRQQAKQAKRPFLFRNHRPSNPSTWDGKQPLRFKSDPTSYSWHDAVMGELTSGPEAIDDFIIIKPDGYPTYNFAHIVDDHLAKITHVIRSQEFLPSVPKFLNLYDALGIEHPVLATLPYVMAAEGNKKLSKRDGAKDTLDYKREGYLPEAMLNFLASLGWNDGTEQEIFSVDELVKKFSLDRVQKSGARFDEKRLEWMNGHYIRNLSAVELSKRAGAFWPPEASGVDPGYKQAILELIQDRLKFFGELAELAKPFFNQPDPEKVIGLFKTSSIPADKLPGLLEAAQATLQTSNFSVKDIAERLNELLKELNTKPAILFSTIRIGICGTPHSPELFGTLAVMGKTKSLQRLAQALEAIKNTSGLL